MKMQFRKERAARPLILNALRLSWYYSNSSADSLNWLLFSDFYGIYYLYSSKIALVFVPVKIFRAKIEPTSCTTLPFKCLSNISIKIVPVT